MYIVLPDNSVWTRYHEDAIAEYLRDHGISGEPHHFNADYLPVVHSTPWVNRSDGRTYLVGRLVGYSYNDLRNGVQMVAPQESKTGFSFSIIGRTLQIVFKQRAK